MRIKKYIYSSQDDAGLHYITTITVFAIGNIRRFFPGAEEEYPYIILLVP